MSAAQVLLDLIDQDDGVAHDDAEHGDRAQHGDEAERLVQHVKGLRINYGPFEAKPEGLLEKIAAARRPACSIPPPPPGIGPIRNSKVR